MNTLCECGHEKGRHKRQHNQLICTDCVKEDRPSASTDKCEKGKCGEEHQCFEFVPTSFFEGKVNVSGINLFNHMVEKYKLKATLDIVKAMRYPSISPLLHEMWITLSHEIRSILTYEMFREECVQFLLMILSIYLPEMICLL